MNQEEHFQIKLQYGVNFFPAKYRRNYTKLSAIDARF